MAAVLRIVLGKKRSNKIRSAIKPYIEDILVYLPFETVGQMKGYLRKFELIVAPALPHTEEKTRNLIFRRGNVVHN